MSPVLVEAMPERFGGHPGSQGSSDHMFTGGSASMNSTVTGDLVEAKMETVTAGDLSKKIAVIRYFLTEIKDLPPWFEDGSYIQHLMTSLNLAGAFTGLEALRWHASEMVRYLRVTRPDNEAEWPSGFSASEFDTLLTSALRLLEAEQDKVPVPE